MSWSKKYKKSIDCSNPQGFSQKAHCAGRKARQSGKDTKSKSVSEMNLSQLKEQVRNILRERSVKAIQKEYSSVVDDIQKHLELYKKSKGTPEEKKHVGHLKVLGEKKKKLSAELDKAVAGLYKNAELKVDESVNEETSFNKNVSDIKSAFKIVYGDKVKDVKFVKVAGLKDGLVKVDFDIPARDLKKYGIGYGNPYLTKVEKLLSKKFKQDVGLVSITLGSGSIQYDLIGESVNEAKTYKKGDRLKIKLPNGKKFDVVFDMYSRTKGVALGKFKNDDGEYNIKPFGLDTIVESVINEDTRRVKLLGIDFKVSEMNGRIFFSFVDKKAASVSLRQVGTNKIVNHIQKRLDIAYGKGTFFFKSGDHAEFQNGYLFQRNAPEINLNKLKFESVNEASEPEIISQLKDIVKNKQYKMIKDPKTGKSLRVDMQTANAVLQIYNGLSNVNKGNMVKMGLPKMIDVSFKILSKYKK